MRTGERELNLNSHTISISPGSLIVFNPGDVHGCKHTSETLFAYDSITIGASLLDGAMLQHSSEPDPEAVALFEQVLDALDAADSEIAPALVLELASMLEVPAVASELSTRHAEAAARVHARLNEDPAQTISIAQLAAEEELSPYALIRAYRKRFSITPLQHLASLRTERACALLAKGITPSEVAHCVGFADQSHLTRVFKQRIGTTPAAYARMITNVGSESGERP